MKRLKKITITFTIVFLLGITLNFFGTSFTNNTVQAAELTLSGWEYYGTFNYNSDVTKFIASTGSILTSAYLPWTGVKVAVSIVVLGYTTFGPNVYVKQVCYRRWVNGTGNFLKPLAGEKAINYYYSDRNRTKYIGSKTHYYYTDWYYQLR